MQGASRSLTENGKLHKRALPRAAVLVAATLIAAAGAKGQPNLAALEERWKRQDYEAVLPLLIDYRSRTNTRTAEIDYMIATSACRLPRTRETGDEFFGWILQNYNLSNQNRTLVESEREKCAQGSLPQRLRAMAPAALVGISYHGKGGAELRASSSGNGTGEVVESIPLEVFSARLFPSGESAAAVAQIGKLAGPSYRVQQVGRFLLVAPAPHSPAFPNSPDALLPGRLNIPNQAAPGFGGVANAAQMRAPNAAPSAGPATANPTAGNLEAVGQAPPPNPMQTPPMGAVQNSAPSVRPPALATTNAPSETPAHLNPPLGSAQMAYQGPAQHPASIESDDAEFKSAGEDLERYLRFFASEYRIPAPPYLIAVYFAPSLGGLEELARRLHGLRLPGGSLGYSFPPDQSMVGWANGKAYGTFAHELFHLTVRNGFGDIPPWLDEGMAALYEVSRFEGDRAVGLPNWRGEILKEVWRTRPGIRELVQMNRSSFDDASGEAGQYPAGARQAANHAAARYFMLYLQQQGRLLQVYSAFRDRSVNDHPARQAVELLESTLGTSLEAVDAAFGQWFEHLR